MRMFHVTPKWNARKILREGLRVDCATDLFWKKIWLATPRGWSWAVHSVSEHYGIHHADVYTFEVWLSHHEVRQHHGKLWYIERDILPIELRGETGPNAFQWAGLKVEN